MRVSEGPRTAFNRDGDGCVCCGCGVRYRVDFNVPDALWQRIGMPSESGLLCGGCIAFRIEELGEFEAFSLVPVIDGDAVARVGIAVRDAMDRVSAQDYDTASAAWAEIGRAAVEALRDIYSQSTPNSSHAGSSTQGDGGGCG